MSFSTLGDLLGSVKTSPFLALFLAPPLAYVCAIIVNVAWQLVRTICRWPTVT